MDAPLTFTPPESAPSGQFWGIYALIGGVKVNHIIYYKSSAQQRLPLQQYLFFIYSYSMYIILRGTVGIYRLSEDPKTSDKGNEEQPNTDEIPRDGDASNGKLIRKQLGERVTTIGSFTSVSIIACPTMYLYYRPNRCQSTLKTSKSSRCRCKAT